MAKVHITLIGFLFIGVGIAHMAGLETASLFSPFILSVQEDWIGFLAGLAVVGGIGVLLQGVRRWAGLGLIALLLAVFPANIHLAVHQLPLAGVPVEPWLLWVRLPVVLILGFWVGRWAVVETP